MKEPTFPWNGTFNYNDEEMKLIKKINDVLTQPLSPRWIYYAIFDVPDAKKQAFLSHVLKKARLDERQLINRDLVTDDTRDPTIWESSDDLTSFMEELNYCRDIWQSQPTYYEVWLEDQASLQAILKSPKRILQKYSMNARYCKGFNSIGAMWESYKFFSKIETPICILYYGDLNPSGWAIPEIIVRQFREMGLDIDLKRYALNVEQLKEFNIPRFTKISGDPRRKEFNLKFGFTRWENEPYQSYRDERTGRTKRGKKHLNVDLEKVPITTFESILETHIKAHLDMDSFKDEKGTEQLEERRLQENIEKYTEV